MPDPIRLLSTPKPMPWDSELARTVGTRRQHHAEALAAERMWQRQPLNLLAVGDSWFDYPLSRNDDGTERPGWSDTIEQLPRWLEPRPTILNLSQFGRMAEEMVAAEKLDLLREVMDEDAHGPFDGILFSGGGNDLFPNPPHDGTAAGRGQALATAPRFEQWLNPAGAAKDWTKAINDAAFEGLLQRVQGYFLQVVALRNAWVAKEGKQPADLPIFIHSYDYAWPDGRGVNALCLGTLVPPWLAPGFHQQGWFSPSTSPAELAKGADVVKRMLQRFGAMQKEISGQPENAVLVVPTQGLLGRDEWANELHPHQDGFARVSQRFAAALAGHWSGPGV